jgi:hypothetical protein
MLLKNNAYSALASSAAFDATILTLTTGTGSRFPAPTGGDYFLATLVGVDGNGREDSWEIVKCTARSNDTLTVERAQENTTAVAWDAGTKVELRTTAGTLGYYEPADATILKDADIGTTVQAQLTPGDGIDITGNVISTSGGTGGPTLDGPADVYVTQEITYTITNYSVFSTYLVQATNGTVSIDGDTITYTAPGTDGTDTLTVTVDGNATAFSIEVLPAGVQTPTNTSPSNGATNQNGSVTLTASAFSWFGLEDTHASSDWQVATDSGFTSLVVNVSGDTSNLTSYTATGLSESQTYYWRVRYTGTSNGTSEWSSAFSFVTKDTFGGLIGTAGGQGFGVGVYLETLPSGFSTLTGYDDPANDNYGNYQYTDGSVMVFVPKFYYRIGSASSPRYATYGANAIDIAGIDTYADTATANAAGYALHRAFIDGGSEKSGFFIDKYLASKNGTTSCKSVQNGVPISLTTTATYTNSNGMTTAEGTCSGILADSVLLARSRGVGTFNVASVFMYSAMALLSLAHGQAATADTYCAWYDGTLVKNFPKGCNNGSLADTNDTGVTFTAAGDSGSASKPLTGSGNPFAKTTHNGQACGVADLNGAMYQVALGITDFGTSATDTTAHANGNAYVLKESVALSSLTHGWDGTNDAWGNTTSLATKYDAVTGIFPWGSTTGWVYLGSGSNQVFSGDTSGTNWLQTACGIQDTTSGADATGTNMFGNDGTYQYNRANLFVQCAGLWGNAADAGVFYRRWVFSRSADVDGSGFRAGAYGS